MGDNPLCEIRDRVLAPLAAQNDKAGRFSTQAVDALGREGLLGLMVLTKAGGSGHLTQLAAELRLAPARAPRTAVWLKQWGHAVAQLLTGTGDL